MLVILEFFKRNEFAGFKKQIDLPKIKQEIKQEMKLRLAKKIHKRWIKLHPSDKKRHWRKNTLEKALNYWLHDRFLPNKISTNAW